MSWIRVASVDEIPDDEALQVKAGTSLVALVKFENDVYAVSDICTHELAYMSEGWVDGPCIECPLHGSSFDVRTGKVMSLPATRDLPTFDVKVTDGEVFVLVEDEAN